MEKGQPNPQRRARSRAITNQSTLSSFASSSSSSSSLSSSSPPTFPSNKFQPNSKRYTRPSNPSNVYPKNTNTQQQQQRQQHHLQLQGDGEEDLTLCSSSSSIVGTCPFMCPVEERVQRERLWDISVFERLNGNPGKTSPSLAVKKFCRTISTKQMQSSDVRPLPVLEDTLNYLLNLLDSKEHHFEVVHEFIFDRTRSIRQDLSMQNVINNQAIQMFEKMVKFHVLSHHKLRRCSGNPNVSSMYYLNVEQLTKALVSLYHLYEAIRSSQSICENEAEFHSLYVLLHLGSDSKPMMESLSLWFRHASTPIIESKEMCFARRVLRYYRLGNYRRFICTTAAEASYLQYCIIEPYINEARALAVSCINYGGYKLHPYPLADLSKLLMMKESDAESLCRDCGLEVLDELGKKFLPTKQASFCRPKGEFQNYDLVGSERF